MDHNCTLVNQTTIPSLTWRSYVLIVVFFLILIPVAYPFTIKLFKNKVIDKITVNFALASFVGTVFLLIITVISAKDFENGIVGDQSVAPYTIIILVITLAYTCVSVDCTGILEYLAGIIAKKAGDSKLRIFFYFYALNSILTIFVSNDVAILTMTPIILYTCSDLKLNPTPFLIGQFISSNTWSTVLLVGNPTNIIVSLAYKISFINYLKYMAVGAIAAGLVSLVFVYLTFFKELNENIAKNIETHDKKTKFDSKWSVISSSALLIVELILLMISNYIHMELWVITLVIGIITFIKDLFVPHDSTNLESLQSPSNSDEETSIGDKESESEAVKLTQMDVIEPENKQKSVSCLCIMKSRALYILSSRMPWAIVPFTLSMFIIVESLRTQGWIERISSFFVYVASIQNDYGFGICLTFISAFLCILLNNQPMTILLTKILISNNYFCGITQRKAEISPFFLILGSNLGGNLAVNGALAGLMWATILQAKGYNMSYFTFMKYGMIATIPAIVIGSVVLVPFLNDISFS